MTVRNPLVLIPGGNPQIQELPAGDTLAGAPQGLAGAAATIAVGTVTSGVSASVTNSGTSSAAIFDFVLPKGDTGATGTAGVGVPVGGTANQVLSKIDATNFNTQWVTPSSGFSDPTTTKGDLIVHGASTTRLAVGSDTQVLTADSAQAAGIKWATPTTGALVLVEQHTASASATLDFTGISGTYDEYVFEFVNAQAATSTANFIMRVGTGAGPTYDSGSNYNWAAVVSNQAAGSGFVGSASDTSIEIGASLGSGATDALVGTVKLFAPADTTFHKRFTVQSFYAQSSGNLTQRNGGGSYKSATAVTAIRFLMSSGNIASGTIRMYGIAK